MKNILIALFLIFLCVLYKLQSNTEYFLSWIFGSDECDEISETKCKKFNKKQSQ